MRRIDYFFLKTHTGLKRFHQNVSVTDALSKCALALSHRLRKACNVQDGDDEMPIAAAVSTCFRKANEHAGDARLWTNFDALTTLFGNREVLVNGRLVDGKSLGSVKAMHLRRAGFSKPEAKRLMREIHALLASSKARIVDAVAAALRRASAQEMTFESDGDDPAVLGKEIELLASSEFRANALQVMQAAAAKMRTKWQ